MSRKQRWLKRMHASGVRQDYRSNVRHEQGDRLYKCAAFRNGDPRFHVLT